MEALELAFFEHGLMFRAVGDTLALSPPLIVSEAQIGEIFDKVGKIIKRWRDPEIVGACAYEGFGSRIAQPTLEAASPRR